MEMEKVGNVIRMGDISLKVKESRSCNGCFFQLKHSGCMCDGLDIVNYRGVVGECLSKKRKDGKSVIFEKI